VTGWRRPTLEPVARPRRRDAVWAAIRGLGRAGDAFAVAEVAHRAKAPVPTARSYMERLACAGILERFEVNTPAGRRIVSYALARDVGVEAPRVNKLGMFEPATRQQLLWAAMKAMPSFSARDLQVATARGLRLLPFRSIANYVRWLERAGYLAARRGRPGPGGAAVWRLLASRNTGPHAPEIRRLGARRAVFDPNLGRFVGALVEPEGAVEERT
jgi:hypothetical protein